MGIAAPLIGIDRAVAIVRTAQGETITLSNPRVIDESPGLTSSTRVVSVSSTSGVWFPRPLALQVGHQDIDGGRKITFIEHGLARLVAHDVDHLHGVLYRAKMRPGVEPIPNSEYRSTGQIWLY
jgi:peptide deformylase